MGSGFESRGAHRRDRRAPADAGALRRSSDVAGLGPGCCAPAGSVQLVRRVARIRWRPRPDVDASSCTIIQAPRARTMQAEIRMGNQSMAVPSRGPRPVEADEDIERSAVRACPAPGREQMRRVARQHPAARGRRAGAGPPSALAVRALRAPRGMRRGPRRRPPGGGCRPARRGGPACTRRAA